MLLLIFLISPLSMAGPFAEIKIPKEWILCEKASDCAIAGDACRSCGKLYVINKKFLKSFNKKDEEAREGRIISCEACSTRDVQIKCEKSQCTYDRSWK